MRTANAVVHDLAAGLWPGAVLALWIAHAGAADFAPAGTTAPIRVAWSGIYAILFLELAIQVVTGLIRLRHRGLGVSTEALAAKNSVAQAKHVAFAAVLLAATVGAVVLLPL